MKILPNNIKPDEYLGKGKELIFLFLFFSIVVISALLAIFYLSIEISVIEFSAIGAIGSIIGGILGPLFALLVGVFTFLAFYVQYDANKKIQDQFKVQQFENQFYKMLDLHKANVDEIKIPYFDKLRKTKANKNTDSIIRNSKEIDNGAMDSFLRHVEGRKAFVDMVQEFHAILSQVNKDTKYGEYENPVKWEYAYRIFFWGLYSELVKSKDFKAEDEKQIKLHLGAQQLFYIKDNDDGKNKKIKTRFIPYQGHESHLAHYYRHLFQTVKYVTKTEESGVISYNQARQYLRILRAQLSNAEQQMLYYNYICGFGREWDRLGEKNNQFLTKYRMIHNIPVDRVKYTENPRIHFQKYILEHCTAEDELFEWGDNENEWLKKSNR